MASPALPCTVVTLLPTTSLLSFSLFPFLDFLFFFGVLVRPAPPLCARFQLWRQGGPLGGGGVAVQLLLLLLQVLLLLLALLA